MFNDINKEYLKNGLENLNIEFDETTIEKLFTYNEFILEWNEKINLTAITDEYDVIRKHFLDSLTLVLFDKFKAAKKIMDIGTGAGFPGIPLAICFPEKSFLLVDSLNKRVKFLGALIEKLELKNVEVIHGRVEELAKNQEYRNKFDIVTSRAVANLSMLTEFAVAFVKVKSYFTPLKGPNITQEIENCKIAMHKLNVEIEEIIETDIFGDSMKHNIVVIKKNAETNIKYPRKFAEIKSKPL